MPLQSQLALVGVAKQTVKGTPVAAAYGHGLRSGSVVQVEVEQGPEEVTLATRGTPGAVRLGVVSGAEFVSRAYPRSSPLWLLGALGTIATTGPVATIYTHVLSGFSADVNYLSFYGRQAADYKRIQDLKVDELTLSWDKTEPLEMALKGIGTILLDGTAFTPTTDDSKEIPWNPVTGTFKVDTGSAVAVTAPISGGSVTIRNGVSPVMLSKGIEPDDVHPGIQQIEVALTLVAENFNEWRKIVTATAAGTGAAAAPTYGSFEMTFVDPSDSVNKTLKLAATKVAFNADFPDANPSGGHLELGLTGFAVIPATGNAFEATVKNGVVSY